MSDDDDHDDDPPIHLLTNDALFVWSSFSFSDIFVALVCNVVCVCCNSSSFLLRSLTIFRKKLDMTRVIMIYAHIHTHTHHNRSCHLYMLTHCWSLAAFLTVEVVSCLKHRSLLVTTTLGMSPLLKTVAVSNYACGMVELKAWSITKGQGVAGLAKDKSVICDWASSWVVV